MKLTEARVPPHAFDELTPDGVAQVLAHLFPVDCQTCGTSLTTGRPPAVEIYQLHGYLRASLHHEECQAPAWITDRPPPTGRQATYHYMGVGMDTVDGHRFSTVVINPNLESVIMQWRDGRLRAVSAETFGFQPFADCVFNRPTPGIDLVVDCQIPQQGHRTVWIRARHSPLWSLVLSAPWVQQARAAGGMMLFACNGFDPVAELAPDKNATSDTLLAMLKTHSACGAWATFLDTEGS